MSILKLAKHFVEIFKTGSSRFTPEEIANGIGEHLYSETLNKLLMKYNMGSLVQTYIPRLMIASEFNELFGLPPISKPVIELKISEVENDFGSKMIRPKNFTHDDAYEFAVVLADKLNKNLNRIKLEHKDTNRENLKKIAIDAFMHEMI